MVNLRLDSAGLTDRGQKRDVNEDTILNRTWVNKLGVNCGLYVICDGLGGHQSGDVASQKAVRVVAKELLSILQSIPSNQFNSVDINHVIWTAVQKANEEICRYGEQSESQVKGMGTTLTMAVVVNHHVHLAHVGDSRLYLFRQGKLEQLTQDHTMAAALAEAGQISQEEIVDHPRQNVLTRALGRRERLKVDMMEFSLEPGDTLLLSSDGFWKAFREVDMLADRLDSHEKPADLCSRLLDEANQRDGSDNLSLIIVSTKRVRAEHNRYRLLKPKLNRSYQTVPV